jgi:tetratricopeptide (TPR) repeat protein
MIGAGGGPVKQGGSGAARLGGDVRAAERRAHIGTIVAPSAPGAGVLPSADSSGLAGRTSPASSMSPSSSRPRSASPASAVRCPRCGRRVAAAAPGCPIHGEIEARHEDVEPAIGPPPHVPGYRALEAFARGGFGAIYRAEPEAGGPPVAIKVARADRAHGEASVRAEAAVLASVGPPHVPALHAHGVLDDGRPFLVMEMIGAPPLSARLLAGPIPLAETCAIGLAILRALAAVHACGHVHRDLKPENILVGAAGPATLVDFGLAALADAEGPPSKSTGEGAAAGTPEYMAPEQCEGRAEIDARADIYAFGVILFELVAGRPPFWGARAVVHEAHRSRRPPQLSTLAEGRAVPPVLEDLVARCLAKDPAERFADVAALAAALTEVAGAVAAAEPALAPASRDAAVSTKRPARADGDRLTVGLLFFEADADVASVQARVIALGGQLAHGGAGRFVAVFGQDLAENPARRALRAAEELLRGRVCERVRVDLAPVAVRPRRDGSKRFVSPLFARGERYPSPADPRGISLSPAAVAVLPDTDSGPGSAPLLPVRAPTIATLADETGVAEVAAWPLHGRDDVLASLVASARAAAFGPMPTMVSVVAGPGLGKSHLYRVLCKRLGDLYVADVLDLRAGEPALGDVDHTLSELLRRALALPAAPPPDGGADLLRERLGAGAELAPAVALALGWVTTAAEPVSTPAPETPSRSSLAAALRALSAAPGALRAGLTVATGDALRRRAAARPLFVVLDDAHYASDVVLSALEYAALAEGGAPIWICALGRPAFAEAQPAWGERAGRREQHHIGPLDPESAAALCRRLLLPVERVPDTAVQRLVERAQAIPLLLVELVRGLRRQGIVRKSPKGEAYYLATDELDLLPHLPVIEWLARAELEALAPALREHARLIALLGAPVTIADIEGVIRRLPQAGAGLDLPLDARIGTHRLMAAGTVVQDAEGRIGFRHELVREAIASGTPEAVRRRIHLAAAAYYGELTPGGAEEGRLAQLAAHSSAAGMGAVAGHAYLALAERARARHAYTEAERLYSRALEQAEGDRGRDRAAAYRGRGLMRYRIGRYHDALADFSCAREMAARAGDAAAEVELYLDEATAFDWMDEYQSSADRVAEAWARMREDQPPILEARLLLGLGRSAHRFSRNEEAATLLERAAAAAEPLGADGYETLVIALMLLGWILPGLGRLADARHALDRVIAQTEAHGDRLHLAAALNNSALCWACLGDKERVIADMQRSLTLARELGQGTLEFLAELNLGDFLMLMDDAAAAEPHIVRAVTIEKKLSGDPVRPAVALVEARLDLLRGDITAARAHVARLREREAAARASGQTLLVPAEEIVCSMIELATGDAPSAAWDDLETRSERVSMGQERIELIEARACAAARRGDLDDARRHLHRALALGDYIPNPMTPRLRRRIGDLDAQSAHISVAEE